MLRWFRFFRYCIVKSQLELPTANQVALPRPDTAICVDSRLQLSYNCQRSSKCHSPSPRDLRCWFFIWSIGLESSWRSLSSLTNKSLGTRRYLLHLDSDATFRCEGATHETDNLQISHVLGTMRFLPSRNTRWRIAVFGSLQGLNKTLCGQFPAVIRYRSRGLHIFGTLWPSCFHFHRRWPGENMSMGRVPRSWGWTWFWFMCQSDSDSAQHISAHLSTSQHISAHLSTSQHISAHLSTSQHISAHLSTSQHISAHLSTSQHFAMQSMQS